MIVLDTSAALDALIGRPANAALVSRLSTDDDLHAPHLLDVELLHALRRLVLRDEITQDRAAEARHDFAELRILRYPHGPLADRIWELRHSLTAYDAAFIALAEALGAPLITADARLGQAVPHRVRVEVFR